MSAIALAGLERASAQFENAAARVTAPAATSGDGGPDTVDLSTAAVALLNARDNFAANIQMLKIADDMQRTAIELLA